MAEENEAEYLSKKVCSRQLFKTQVSKLTCLSFTDTSQGVIDSPYYWGGERASLWVTSRPLVEFGTLAVTENLQILLILL